MFDEFVLLILGAFSAKQTRALKSKQKGNLRMLTTERVVAADRTARRSKSAPECGALGLSPDTMLWLCC